MENDLTTDADVLASLVQWHESAEQSTADSRAESERERDYVNGAQWTDEEVAKLNKRKQPVVTINRIGPKIRFLLGMEQQRRAEPRAFPRTPEDEDGANAASDAIRFVMDENRWDRLRSECFDEFLVEGACGLDVKIVEKYGEPCIELHRIPWDRMWGDPHAFARNWNDGKYKGQFLWMDLEDAQAKWPGKEAAISATVASETDTGQTFDDKPRVRWADPKRKRVRIAECWSKEGGKVFHNVFTKGGILEREESPYVNEDGEPEGGFVFGSCWIDRDGNRFGVVRDWMSIQDEINKRRSKAMHLLNTRQTFGNKMAGDKNAIRAELAKPDGHVEMEGGAKFGEDFGVLPTGDMAAAQFDLLQEAKSEIDAVGVNSALAGKEQRVMSGRALMARSEQGLAELEPVFDAFKQWQIDVYRCVWNRIKQFWTAEKWVRVTDDDKNMRFVGLNRPMTLGEQLLDEAKKQGQKITPEMEQQAKMDPAMQQIVGIRNNVAEMDVDIVIDEVPASASLQIEQFEALTQIAPQAGSMPPPLFEALIEASQLRNKDKILKKLRGEDEEVSPELAQAQEQLQAMGQELQQAQAQIADKRGDMAIKAKELQIKERELQLKQAEAAARVNAPQDTGEAEAIARERQALEADRRLLEMEKRNAELELQVAQLKAIDAVKAVQGAGEANAKAEQTQAKAQEAQSLAAAMQQGFGALLQEFRAHSDQMAEQMGQMAEAVSKPKRIKVNRTPSGGFEAETLQ